jgi:hypothetical protein
LSSHWGTRWGLFRHYWVLFKFVLTILAVGVLLMNMSTITLLSDAAARMTFSGADLRGARTDITIGPGGGLLVLLVNTVLAVYKPRGMSHYGQRKQRAEDHQQRAQSQL